MTAKEFSDKQSEMELKISSRAAVWKQNTWRNIIYVMQGIRNGWSWKEIPPLSQNTDYIRRTIQEIPL